MVSATYVLASPRISTPPPALVSVPPALPLMTPDRMPAVIIVPVLALLLTVIVRAEVPRAMLLVISVSPSAVEEPRTSCAGAKFVDPQVRPPPPRVTTSRSGVEAAKPELPPGICTVPPVPATGAAKVRENVPVVSRTPPLMTKGLLAERPWTASAELATLSAPAEMVVVPP